MTTGGVFPNATDNYSQSDIRELRCYMQYIIFHIKEVQSTIILDDNEEEDDEMRQLLRTIELSQREEDQREEDKRGEDKSSQEAPSKVVSL